ncbi:MAG: hypothetical protein ABWY06_23585 [Pseudomonas sp.]|uniref:hypothetical protein n=1 Tax=Pseudomonas sp. TaxID=306 RepID=UPI0033976234
MNKRRPPTPPRRVWALAGNLLAGLMMLIAFVFFIVLTLKTPIERSAQYRPEVGSPAGTVGWYRDV